MNTFRISNYEYFCKQIMPWLWKNVGPGGSWLTSATVNNKEPVKEEGDEWGIWHEGSSGFQISIIDNDKAILFALKWI